jgi:hypothetical protein
MTAPSGIEFVGNGISRAAADARYIPRFVAVAGVPVEAGATYAVVAGSGATEVALGNPSGAVESLLPMNASGVAFREALDGARISNRLKINRVGNTPVLAGVRAAGTYQAPTPPVNNDVLFQVNSRPVTDTGGAGASTVTGGIAFRARENLGAAAWGTQIEMITGRVGAAATDIPMIIRGAAGLSEWLLNLATGRIIPGATSGALRNPANTVNVIEWNATGLGFFNVAPIARPNITGSRGGNAALASLLTQGALLGLWTDGTTA